MSQNDTILRMLEQGPITAMDALRGAGCMRLAARIDDLRRRGHNIVTHTVSEGGKKFAKYFLVRAK